MTPDDADINEETLRNAIRDIKLRKKHCREMKSDKHVTFHLKPVHIGLIAGAQFLYGAAMWGLSPVLSGLFHISMAYFKGAATYAAVRGAITGAVALRKSEVTWTIRSGYRSAAYNAVLSNMSEEVAAILINEGYEGLAENLLDAKKDPNHPLNVVAQKTLAHHTKKQRKKMRISHKVEPGLNERALATVTFAVLENLNVMSLEKSVEHLTKRYYSNRSALLHISTGRASKPEIF